MRNSNKKNFFVVLLIFLGIWFYSGCSIAEEPRNASNPKSNKPIKIGYFFGGKSYILFRLYINSYFKKEGVNVELYSQYMNKDGFYKVPKSYEEMQRKKWVRGKNTYFGKVTGIEIIKAIEEGALEAGTVGESSFVYAVTNNSPIVAVAMLAHDTIERPAKGIFLRKDIIIDSPEDFKGKTLISRRAGFGEAVFLREFIESIGLNSEKDVTIIDQVSEDEAEKVLEEEKVDGGLYHVNMIRRLIKKGSGYLYRKMGWMNPEISHGLLVFRKDFVETYPEEVKKIMRAYMKRIKYEQTIPEEAKIKEKRKGLRMVLYCQGMNLPQYTYPPLIRLDLLKEIQRLLLKYEFIDKKVDLEGFINNDFIKEAYEELK